MADAVRLRRISDALSSARREWCFYPGDAVPQTLLELLQQQFPTIDTAGWDLRFRYGGIYVNGRPAKSSDASMRLQPPVRVEYFEPKVPLEEAYRSFPSFSKDLIVFEDDNLIVVYKPPGISSMPTREQGTFNLEAFVSDYVGQKIHMPSRLDTSAQGLSVMSKSARMHDRLQKVYEHRQVRKYYLLRTAGSVGWEHKLVDSPIGRDPLHPVLRQVIAGGQAASTLFHRIEVGLLSVSEQPLESTLLRARPYTGRTHQIRVHARSIGFPIIGDNFYGGVPAPQLMLLGFRARFRHPLSGTVLDIAAPDRLLPAWASLTPQARHQVMYG